MASTLVAPLSSLLNSSTLDDHEESLKQANAAIKKNKTNQDAQHRRVVALLKLDRFEDALDALKEGGEGLAARCVLENAYALYKTGRLEEAAAVVRGQSSDLPGIKHIAAQVAYRAERFEDAAGIYKDLSSRQGDYDGEENDLRINVWATEVQQDWQEGVRGKRTMKRKPGREDLETFETVFNVACGYIAAGELTAGNLLLKRARDLCEAFDELTDEEKRAEVLPIMVQQIYVLTRLGKLEEAEQLQKHIEVAGYVLRQFLH
jgi:signal recognition particle subunit SRP72